jgi:aralkylamine N-acetyltransferase
LMTPDRSHNNFRPSNRRNIICLFGGLIKFDVKTTMNINIKYDIENIDWVALCEIFRLAPLGTRDPAKLKTAANQSHTVCSAYAGNQLIGFGRALSDGQYQSAIYDVVVLPDYQNQGVGKAIMKALLAKLPKSAPVLIFASPGKQDFYKKFGFGNLRTGMGLFPNPELSKAKGYLE